MTVDDPNVVKPWSFSLPLTVNDDEPLYDACHEGNYAIKNILSWSRRSDAKPEAVAK